MTIRGAVAVVREDGFTRFRIEWVEVDEQQNIVNVLAAEEFRVKDGKEGCVYLTRGAFSAGGMEPGSLWIDEEGHRHFFLAADSGAVGAFGRPIGA